MNSSETIPRENSNIAVVTGAGSGIGRASSLALLANGWSVVLVGRRKSALEETARLSGDASSRAVPIPTDIGKPDEVATLFDKVKQHFDRLDFLFNNAGDNVPSMPIEDVTYADWQRVVQTNVTGSFLCAQHAFRLMKMQNPMGGRIVNNGAPSAHIPRPDATTYTVTRHAITGLTKALSLDGRKYDIACGQIDVGNVEPPEGGQHAAKQADGTLAVEPTMDVKYVANMLVIMANMPLEVNVQSVFVMPTKMPFIGRG
ncbi:MAG: SDR family NAD(P)-dependent oxidoreductase [Rhizonema sp. NSF051]|nr:SDR family NAD(P)-dependent oxidoreductase [Rhizonema sp. NSF051]